MQRPAKTLILASSLAVAASPAAVAASGDLDIYTARFTSGAIKEDILTTIDRCETDLSCAGVSFEPNGTVTKTKLYHHSFVGKYKTEKTYETKKLFTYHRGRVTAGNVLSVAHNLTVAQAKERCTASTECVALTYPVRSLSNLLTLSSVTFLSTVDGFAPSDNDTWRSYISNDMSRSSRVNADVLEYDESVVRRPYRSCCNREDIPSIEEVAKADSLERISCNISREEFFLKYEVPRKAVMLVGCEKDWPAVREDKWLAENLAPRFSNHTIWRARIGGEKKLRSEHYNHNVRWGDIAEAMLTGKAYYLFDQLFDPEAKDIDNDYEDPMPVAGGDLYAKLPHFNGPLRWFCHGPQGTGTKSHMDPFGTDAWNTLIKGHKWWLIYPDGFTDNSLLECEDECSVETPLVTHWYASVGINGARSEFPLDKYARHVLQHPGETIYVPDGLLHSVLNMDETIAITKNYASAANLDKVWMETVTDGDPLKWRMMYYHTLNWEQRMRVRRSPYWPPQRWEKKEESCTKTTDDNMDRYPMFNYDASWTPEIGDVVEARYRGDIQVNEWNCGKITDMVGNMYAISYSDGDEDLLPFEHLGRLPQIGDTVEAQYNGKFNEWYMGTVTGVTDDGVFDVVYADGEGDEDLARKSVREFVPYEDGEVVQVLLVDENEDGFWMNSMIIGRNEDGTYRLKKRDGEVIDSVSVARIRRLKWEFNVGDEVAAHVSFNGEYDWYRGRVTKARKNDRYDLELDDGDDAYCISWRSIRLMRTNDELLGLEKD